MTDSWSTLVKICGVSEPEHARIAVEAGADLIGVVFYPPSIRYVSLSRAREISDIAHGFGGQRVRVVGLFVNATIETMNASIEAADLDLIQLSGDETPSILPLLTRPAIATIRVDSRGKTDEEALFRRWTEAEHQPYGVQVDSHVDGMYGGTGTVSDWFVAADFARRFSVILAGGLAPTNVAAAIELVHPMAVDVSSGVETGGVKDPEKIRAFVHAAKHVSPAAQHPFNT